MRQCFPRARGLVAAVLVLGFVAEAQAAAPRGLLLQRRGNNRYTVPAKPAIIDSSPTIDTLNKALKALGATDRDYDGHREKAIGHISEAIHHLETSAQKGKSNAAVEKAALGQAATPTATATTPEAASDESLRKAKAILFNVHHELVEHVAMLGARSAPTPTSAPPSPRSSRPSSPAPPPPPRPPPPPGRLRRRQPRQPRRRRPPARLAR